MSPLVEPLFLTARVLDNLLMYSDADTVRKASALIQTQEERIQFLEGLLAAWKTNESYQAQTREERNALQVLITRTDLVPWQILALAGPSSRVAAIKEYRESFTRQGKDMPWIDTARQVVDAYIKGEAK